MKISLYIYTGSLLASLLLLPHLQSSQFRELYYTTPSIHQRELLPSICIREHHSEARLIPDRQKLRTFTLRTRPRNGR